MKNTVRTMLAFVATGLFASAAVGQTQAPAKQFCGTEVPDMAWENEFQRLLKERKETAKANKTQAQVYTIPVIIHVIHGGQAPGVYPNLAQGQLVSQILVLNNDFSGSGFNSGNYPSTAYSNWAQGQLLQQNITAASVDANGSIRIADCQVQFCLATKDTMGNILPEPGIERINWTTKPGWQNPGTISNYNTFKNFIDNVVKPQTIWNVSRYLNIWVTDSDINSINLLGYATFPVLAGISGIPNGTTGSATTDGYWCYAKAFGSVADFPSGTYYNGYNRGRTSTHEIGHWVGLRHIWGDGNCSATDYCNDTPPASASNFGAPTYPFKTNVCSGNSPNGEMFMNFMDYTNDPVKYMFTQDQADRVQTAMANSPYRKFLGTHNLCSVDYVSANAAFTNILSICTGLPFKLTNTSSGFPAPSYTWSASGAGTAMFSPASSATSPSVSFSTPGTYVITLAADNGTLSTISKTITVTSPQMFLSASPQTVCAGGSSTLSAAGLSTFTWEPGGTVWYEIVEQPQQAMQVYTVTGTQVNGCTATQTIALYTSICTGLEKSSLEPLNFAVYPNPAKEWLTIGGAYSSSIAVEITDALGRRVLSRQLSFDHSSPEQQLNIAPLENGVYIVSLRSNEGRQQFVKFIKE